MSGDPIIFALLEDMLESGKTPEEVCRDHPELLAEVRLRWEQFRQVDAGVNALLPGSTPAPDDEAATPPPQDGPPQVPDDDVEADREDQQPPDLDHP